MRTPAGSVAAVRALAQEVVACARCPRLRAHCAETARVRVRRFRDQEYWGRPVPSFGDPRARLLIVGLAPAAHGANRTGRMFTGDDSGAWLYRALHDAGFASQAESLHRDDGLALRDAYVTAAAHCAPPGNRPSPAEIAACRPFLARELALLSRARVVLALGQIAWDAVLAALACEGVVFRPRPRFGHQAEVPIDARRVLLGSYHPSRQNTQTGRLTREMLASVLARARALV
ncbi:uracil-DNA glycosylase [Candidatus Binatia bacterium]|nr:uracil-DNA glycosylase [Candidatus Binatia bacterium]